MKCVEGKTARILIVEDEVLVALNMADDLTLAGFQIIGSARSVSEALQIAYRMSPDIAIFDISLGGKRDGIEGAKLLQRDGVEVIFQSSWTDEVIVSRAMALEPVAFLSKPYAPNALLAAVQAAVEKLNPT